MLADPSLAQEWTDPSNKVQVYLRSTDPGKIRLKLNSTLQSSVNQLARDVPVKEIEATWSLRITLLSRFPSERIIAIREL